MFDKDKAAKDWSLHLVGSASEGDKSYIEELKELSKDYPIELHPSLAFKELVTLAGESSVYWHAMGYRESDPKKMEHPEMTPEMQKISDQLQAELKGKPAGEAVWLKNYEFEGKKKEGVAYRIDDRDICMAFWVIATDKVK